MYQTKITRKELQKVIDYDYEPKLDESSIENYLELYCIPENEVDIIRARLRNLKFNPTYEGAYMKAEKELCLMYNQLITHEKLTSFDEVCRIAKDAILDRIANDRMTQYVKSYLDADDI